MPYLWHLESTRGAVRLRREWVLDENNPHLKPFGHSRRWGSADAPRRSAIAGPRGDDGLSPRARNRMRWLFMSLPWEMLGERLVMLTLTYPGEWREWVPDGRVLNRHRRAFLERWRRQWGAPMGVWVKEFQKSGRPHLHVYLALPDAVSTSDYLGLRERTLLRNRLQREFGTYDGRRRLPAIGQQYGGDFAMWLRDSWSEVVGTQGILKAHHARGVDVSVAFWSDDEAKHRDRVTVATYLAGESSKHAQKQPPDDFSHVGRYYGHVGDKQGFGPESSEVEVHPAVAYELERRLTRLVRARMIAKRRRWGHTGPMRFDERRLGSGVLALDVQPTDRDRLVRWCEAAAERKQARRRAAGEPEMDAWGPSWSGLPADVVSRLRGEDTRVSVYEPDVRPCGCGAGEICEDCIHPDDLWRITNGCGCRPGRVCDACFEPPDDWEMGA